MAKIRHLEQAPVIEVILGFQADLGARFPGFPEIQELRMFENQISFAPRKEPESSTTIHPVEGFILRNSKHAAAVQIRRDGFAFSKLEPHSNWDSFVSSAQEQWKVFAEWFEVDVPFNVFIRYINRVSYPIDNFKLTNYFEHPPLPPSGTNWAFRFFRDATPFSPPPVFLTVFIPKANS